MTHAYSPQDHRAAGCPAWRTLIDIRSRLTDTQLPFCLLGEWAVNVTIGRITNGDIEILVPAETPVSEVWSEMISAGFGYAGTFRDVTAFENNGLFVYVWQNHTLHAATEPTHSVAFTGQTFTVPKKWALPMVLQLQFELRPAFGQYVCDPIRNAADLLVVHPEMYGCVSDLFAARLAAYFKANSRLIF